MASAFQRAGREGQALASQLLREDTARLREITDKEHYTDALERTTQAVEKGLIDPNNKEFISAFAQNQYLLNKTKGARDLGGQFGAFGIGSQLGAGDGLQKYITARLNPLVHTATGDIVAGLEGDKTEFVTYIDDEDGKEKFLYDDNGRRVPKNTHEGTTQSSAFLTNPDFSLQKKKLDYGMANDPMKEFKVDFDNVQDDLKLFVKNNKDNLDSLGQLLLYEKKAKELKIAIKEDGDEDGTLQNELDEKLKTIENLKNKNAQMLTSLEDIGYKYDESTGNYVNKLNYGTITYDKGKRKVNTKIKTEFVLDPTNMTATPYFWIEEKKKGKTETEKVDLAGLNDYLANKSGVKYDSGFDTKEYDFNVNETQQKKGEKKVEGDDLDNIIKTAFDDMFISRSEAINIIGPEAAVMYDASEANKNKAIEKLSVDEFMRRMDELDKASAKANNGISAFQNVKSFKSVAESIYNKQGSLRDAAFKARNKSQITENAIIEKTNAIEKISENLDSAVVNQFTDETKRFFGFLAALSDKYQNKFDNIVKLNPNLSVTLNGKTTIPVENFVKSAERDKVYNVISNLTFNKLK